VSARRLTRGLRVIVVLGPTATGKTELALLLARELGGEVVSADARYFYRGMDIGTAKPSMAERADVVHHLIDILEPHAAYSLATFLDDAYAAIEDIARRGRVPIVAGGTPQYLRALLEGWTVPEVPPDERLRERLQREETAALYARLQQVDPRSAERTGPHNKRRIMRALEVYEVAGRRMSELAGQSPPPYRFLIVGLTQPRESLYERIDRRVRDMYARGWLDEVRGLKVRGVDAAMPSMSAHGYREALAVIDGSMTVDEAIARTCFIIHRYVRHQQTWFRRFDGVQWFDSSELGYQTRALDFARRFLAGDASAPAELS
jgi:tRNA dimethylallyltransferase